MAIIRTKQAVSIDDYKELSESLMKLVVKLQAENRELREKLEHLEGMLLNSDVIDLGKK